MILPAGCSASWQAAEAARLQRPHLKQAAIWLPSCPGVSQQNLSLDKLCFDNGFLIIVALPMWLSRYAQYNHLTCRNIHTRVRTHAESIAFFGGGAREGQTVAAQYDSLMGHLRRVVNIRCGSACSQHDSAGWIPSALYLAVSTRAFCIAPPASEMWQECLGLTLRTDL